MKILYISLIATNLLTCAEVSKLAERREIPQLTINITEEERINNCCVNIKSSCDKDELKFKAKMTLILLTSAGIIATTTGLVVHFLDSCGK